MNRSDRRSAGIKAPARPGRVHYRHAGFEEQLLVDLDVAAGTTPGSKRAAFRRLQRLLPGLPLTPGACADAAEQIRARQTTTEETTTSPTTRENDQ